MESIRWAFVGASDVGATRITGYAPDEVIGKLPV